MATTTAHITWMPLAGTLGYTFEYKLKSSSTWITPGPPSNPANPTLNTFYDLEVEEGEEYDGRLSSLCASGRIRYVFFDIIPPDPTPVLVWEEDTYQCTQTGSGLTLDDTFTGFSSPGGTMWDNTSGRFYVVDFDDVLGVFWWFDPDTITGFASANHISGSITTDINTFTFDVTNRRIIAAGDGTGGAKVLDIAAGSVVDLPYGTDTSPGTGRRAPIILSSNRIYAFCKSPDIIRTYNRSTLVFIQEILKSGVPSASTYMPSSEGYHAVAIGSEIWILAASRSASAVARYDSDFTTLNGTIALPGSNVATGSGFGGRYWMNFYYNQDTNRLFIGDLGSQLLFVINTATNTVVNTVQITNMRGKDYGDFAFSKSEFDGSLYMQVRGVDTLSDGSPNFKLYKIDVVTGELLFIYPDAQASNVSWRAGTNEQWGVAPGLVSWPSFPPGWDTDGLVLKYIS